MTWMVRLEAWGQFWSVTPGALVHVTTGQQGEVQGPQYDT